MVEEFKQVALRGNGVDMAVGIGGAFVDVVCDFLITAFVIFVTIKVINELARNPIDITVPLK